MGTGLAHIALGIDQVPAGRVDDRGGASKGGGEALQGQLVCAGPAGALSALRWLFKHMSLPSCAYPALCHPRDFPRGSETVRMALRVARKLCLRVCCFLLIILWHASQAIDLLIFKGKEELDVSALLLVWRKLCILYSCITAYVLTA